MTAVLTRATRNHTMRLEISQTNTQVPISESFEMIISTRVDDPICLGRFNGQISLAKPIFLWEGGAERPIRITPPNLHINALRLLLSISVVNLALST
jgi:hypothetical protein